MRYEQNTSIHARFTYLSFGSTTRGGCEGQPDPLGGGAGHAPSSTVILRGEKRRRKLIFDYVPWSLLDR